MGRALLGFEDDVAISRRIIAGEIVALEATERGEGVVALVPALVQGTALSTSNGLGTEDASDERANEAKHGGSFRASLGRDDMSEPSEARLGRALKILNLN